MFGGRRHYYGYNSWNSWGRDYRGRRPFYGGTQTAPLYGSRGQVTQTAPRYQGSAFAGSGGFRRASASVRGAGTRQPRRRVRGQRQIADARLSRAGQGEGHMTQTLQTFLVAAVDTLIVFLILLLAKKLRDVRFRASFDVPSGADPAEFTADHQIEEKGNVAVALRRCGLSVAFGFGLAGVVSGGMRGFAAGVEGVEGFLQDTGLIVVDCLILLVFLFFAQFVVEKIILRRINNNEALKDTIRLSDSPNSAATPPPA